MDGSCCDLGSIGSQSVVPFLIGNVSYQGFATSRVQLPTDSTVLAIG